MSEYTEDEWQRTGAGPVPPEEVKPNARRPRGSYRRLLSAITAAVLVIGAVVGVSIARHSTSLPTQLTSARFARLVSEARQNAQTSQFSARIQLGLGPSTSMSEIESGSTDPANAEQQLEVKATITAPGSSPLTFENLTIKSFGHQCYGRGSVIAPITGQTGVPWLSIKVPKVKSTKSTLASLAQSFRGTVRATKMPADAPAGPSMAYRASGSFTLERIIASLGSSLPTSVSHLSSNVEVKKLFGGISMSFKNAVAVVSSGGALLSLTTPLTVSISSAALDGSGASKTYTGFIEMADTPASPLHLSRPSPETVTTPSVVESS